MTASAWAFLAAVWAIVLAMTGYSFYKLVISKRLLGDDTQYEAPVTGHPHQGHEERT